MVPALSQTQAPTVVSVSVTGNAHIATDRILAVVKTKVGDPFNPAVVQDDLRSISDLGFFADQAPPVIKQRPDGIAITFRKIRCSRSWIMRRGKFLTAGPICKTF